jgi:hypothetical protein
MSDDTPNPIPFSDNTPFEHHLKAGKPTTRIKHAMIDMPTREQALAAHQFVGWASASTVCGPEHALNVQHALDILSAYANGDLAKTQTPDTEPPLSVHERMAWEYYMALMSSQTQGGNGKDCLRAAFAGTDAFLAARKEKPL